MIITAALPYVLMKPHIGVFAFHWLSLMNPHRLTWGFTYGFGFAQIVALTTLLSWMISRERKRIPWTPIAVAMAVWAVWISITTVFAVSPSWSLPKWIDVMKILLMTFVTIVLIHNRERLTALIWVVAVSIGFYGIKGGIFVFVTGGQYMVLGPPSSQIASNNDIALALVMVLPLLRYLQLHTPIWWVRWGLVGTMGLTFAAIGSTYSRGCFLALVAMSGVLWIKSRRRLLIAGAVAAGVGSLFVAMPDKWIERIDSIREYRSDASSLTRLNMWRYGFKVAKANPVTGGGFNIFGYQPLYPRFGLSICKRHLEVIEGENCVMHARNAHSVWFEVMGEHGFVGLALFLVLGVTALATGRWIIRNTRDRPDLAWARDLAILLQVSLVGYAVGGTFYNRAFLDLYYTLVAIMAVTRVVVARELAAEPAPDAAAADTASPALRRYLGARQQALPGGRHLRS